LQHKGKRYEIIKKTEKEKEEKRKKIKRASGNPFGPAKESAHGPFGETRTGMRPSSLPR
jgi:hypothetical protein